MTRFLIALLSAALALAGSQSPAGRPTPGPLLRIDAVALDSRGNPVTDLTKDELEVRIANYRVPIESLTASDASAEGNGRVIVLLMDDAVVPLALTPRVREIARRFVDRMSPGDRMAIVALNGGAMELTADRNRLLKGINDYTVRAVGFTRLDLAGEHVLNTVTTLSRQLAEESPGRKTVVGIGAAWLFDTPIPPPTVGRDLRPEWTAAMRAAGFANVNVYAIEPGGVETSRFERFGRLRERNGWSHVRKHQRFQPGGRSGDARSCQLLRHRGCRSAHSAQIGPPGARCSRTPPRRDRPGEAAVSRHRGPGQVASTSR